METEAAVPSRRPVPGTVDQASRLALGCGTRNHSLARLRARDIYPLQSVRITDNEYHQVG
jgi:hypothetical protein